MAKLAELVMPKLGLTMTEGTLVKWKVARGEQVRAGDILFVVETEKVTNEIEAAGGRSSQRKF
jgi:pyruvate dehydrogenase E2 component (dihydrolipoamide acetyltransferase)